MFKKITVKRLHSSTVGLNFTSLRIQHSKDFEILSFCRSGLLFEAIRVLNSSDPEDLAVKQPLLYASMLQTATKVRLLSQGLQIHAHIIKSGVNADRLVGNSLLALYFKLGPNFDDASKVFDGLFVRDVISWTSMICGYIRVDKPNRSIQTYMDMLNNGIEPNAYTLSAVIKGSADLEDVKFGQCFQGTVIKAGFVSNCVIGSALIDMYGKTHKLKEARQAFDELLEPDSVCWTSMISALTRNDLFKEALSVFYKRHSASGVILDEFTYGSVLSACGNIGLLKQGMQMHAKLIVEGFCGHVIVESSLVDMYGRCGTMAYALCVFDRMPTKNSVSWSALLGSYCHNGDFESVIQMFRMMDNSELYSFGSVLRACAGLAAIKLGKEVHCQYVRRGGKGNVIVESALVDLYAKNGCVNFAQRIFSKMPVKNLITWNSMICGFATNGRGIEAIELYTLMVEQGIKPDYISFVGVLFACSHAGLVEQGRKLFTSMTDEYGVRPGLEHYNCMVDLLGRAGLLEEAEHLIEKADCKGAAAYLWPALLGACTTSGNSDAAESVAKKMMEIDPHNHLSYVHLINVYKSVGRWNDSLRIRKLMKDRGIEKHPGMSWTDSTKQLGVP